MTSIRVSLRAQKCKFKVNSKMNQCQLFCKFHCTHAKDNKKSMLARKSMFFMRMANPQIRNFAVISNVMTFLTLCVKVYTVYSFKDHISIDNEDYFIKFAE